VFPCLRTEIPVGREHSFYNIELLRVFYFYYQLCQVAGLLIDNSRTLALLLRWNAGDMLFLCPAMPSGWTACWNACSCSSRMWTRPTLGGGGVTDTLQTRSQRWACLLLFYWMVPEGP
jgi:hypothetical protein